MSIKFCIDGKMKALDHYVFHSITPLVSFTDGSVFEASKFNTMFGLNIEYDERFYSLPVIEHEEELMWWDGFYSSLNWSELLYSTPVIGMDHINFPI